jgi:hypothetical protein
MEDRGWRMEDGGWLIGMTGLGYRAEPPARGWMDRPSSPAGHPDPPSSINLPERATRRSCVLVERATRRNRASAERRHPPDPQPQPAGHPDPPSSINLPERAPRRSRALIECATRRTRAPSQPVIPILHPPSTCRSARPAGVAPSSSAPPARPAPPASRSSRSSILHQPASRRQNPRSAVTVAGAMTFHGPERDRTADPLLAKQVLSQLSYRPGRDTGGAAMGGLQL